MTRSLISAALTALLVILGGCGCQQSAYRALPSPDQQYVVIEIETNCGATDPFGTAISIQSRQPRLGIQWLGFPSKRVFLADVSIKDTEVRWLDKRNLEIVCDDAYCVKYGIAEMVRGWKDVKISFDIGQAKKGEY